MYHLKNSGLPNVWLQDGYQTGEDKFGPYYSITDIPCLYRAIAMALAHGGGLLSPDELRVIRRQLNLTQKQLAEKLGRTEQTVLLWERNRPNAKHGGIPADAAQLIKLILLQTLSPQLRLDEAFRHLQQPKPHRIVMTRVGGQWDCVINHQTDVALKGTLPITNDDEWNATNEVTNFSFEGSGSTYELMQRGLLKLEMTKDNAWKQKH